MKTVSRFQGSWSTLHDRLGAATHTPLGSYHFASQVASCTWTPAGCSGSDGIHVPTCSPSRLASGMTAIFVEGEQLASIATHGELRLLLDGRLARLFTRSFPDRVCLAAHQALWRHFFHINFHLPNPVNDCRSRSKPLSKPPHLNRICCALDPRPSFLGTCSLLPSSRFPAIKEIIFLDFRQNDRPTTHSVEPQD